MSSLIKNVGIALTKDIGSSQSFSQSGGAKGVKSSSNAIRGRNLMLAAFVWTLVILLIKVVLVHYSWNYLGPRMMPNNFREITVADSIAIVVLVQALFN
jgi:hypothetical protein